ncbi:hypothetical protein GCM10011617_16770 [Novosphingobium arvoryzae]|uniref:HTH marR-type domain-containing protein n=2 Tax=Novosphingobium arvoryzae TaxID=1256514 RepID=A0A918VHL3_9SPHN|nr:hypothetical protein GCM10011617_16770 [Novosphingobium arvoryzae]
MSEKCKSAAPAKHYTITLSLDILSLLIKSAGMDMPTTYLISDSSRLLRRAFDNRVRTLGVTGPQARLLLVLSVTEGENQGYYAERLDVEPITLCRMVDRMEEAGLLERRRDPADRRAWQVHLTERSRPMIERLRECVEQLNDDMQAGLDANQRSLLADALERVRMNLGGNPAPAYRTSANG